ncbi:MAG: hypothetical protein J1E79_03265 [Rikenella sp.]|nr:hypothetical protein [Rikenella sp.]
MKTLGKKTVFAACGGLLIMGSVYLSCRWAQTATPTFSDLTLANIEALAANSDEEKGVGGVVLCQGAGHVWCPLTNTSEYSTVMVVEIPNL